MPIGANGKRSGERGANLQRSRYYKGMDSALVTASFTRMEVFTTWRSNGAGDKKGWR